MSKGTAARMLGGVTWSMDSGGRLVAGIDMVSGHILIG